MQNQSSALSPFHYQAQSIFDRLDVSDPTRADYQARIGSFLSYVENKGLNRDSFLEYKRYLATRTDWAVSTKNKNLAVARIFLKECNRIGLLPADITQNVKSFTQSRKHKRDGLTEDEVSLLTERLRAIPNAPSNARLKAIVALLALQGLRQIEVIRLNVNDLHLARNVAYIQGKGRDDKEPVSLHPVTVQALREYLKSNQVADGALFVSNSNNSLKQRLTSRSLQRIVRETFQQLGIAKSVHGLRHYYATKLIRAYQGDLLQVARYTRHSSISTLQIYFDDVQSEADLPRYYQTFQDIKL